MRYLERRPSAAAADHVKLYWMLEHGRDEVTLGGEPVVPDGCVEIIFDLKDRFVTYRPDGRIIDQPRSIIAGQITSRIVVGPTGDTDMFGVRLNPEAAFSLLRVPMFELRDKIVDLAEIIGPPESIAFERIAAAKTFEERIRIFEQLFVDNDKNVNRELAHCITLMRSSCGSDPITSYASSIGWSERRLERAFNQYIGVRPKLYSRIIRFRSFLSAIEERPTMLLDNALAAGYHDQSHMIRDFKDFALMTPTEYFNNVLSFGDLFSGSSRSVSEIYNTADVVSG